ncbi:MAG: toll/interleukin-1 receptor domain-containing protein, partial [Planctomycetota bacterium]|nr:toll/interleukin-1 receptor domain-containing protein [Planctomycetota bacterium]
RLGRKSKQHQIKVLRFAVVTCGECGTKVERSQMRKRLAAGKDFAFCAECGERLSLPPADKPVQLTGDVRQQLNEEDAVIERRAVFEEVVYRLKSRANAEDIAPQRCFLSYAWRDLESGQQELPVERWVARLAEDLQKAGHDVILDQTHNEHFGQSIARFIEEIPKCDRVLVVGTPLYLKKHENEEFENGTIVAAEMDLIAQRLTGTEAAKKTVIGLLLEGRPDESLPTQLRGRTYADFRDEDAYFIVTFDLMLTLYGLSFSLPGIKEWRQTLRGREFLS